MPKFKIRSEYKPRGDQPNAIDSLVDGVLNGDMHQVLVGATGTGKTFTMANIIEKVQKPTIILAHNKTLAAQLYSEFKEFFPENSVEYFVSYYDYYQPEAYVVSSDTFIEKDSSRNDEIDKLRYSATAALVERKDVIIVASVSCIYGLGDPIDYENLAISLRPGMTKDRDELIRRLVDIQYERNDIDFRRGCFRVKGDTVEIYPIESSGTILRVVFFGDEIEKLIEIDNLTGDTLNSRSHYILFPASHYATTPEKLKSAIKTIQQELQERIVYFKENDKLLEAQRIEQRTLYDLEMMQVTGSCSGIENYSRHISGREPGSAPFTLIDYFGDDYLMFIDESHVTVPQIGAMYNGDKSRKDSLIEYGFRLPSAYDNRPLKFEEFEDRVSQVIYVSATPSKYEYAHATNVTEQIIRPTGLIDPEIEIQPIKGQIDHLIGEINKRTARNERVLVTTLTKRMAEDLTTYLSEVGIKVQYLHSDVETLERIEILRQLRLGEFDVLVGINLLREGLDLPEVSLVAILDADKQGFLRSETSLIQTIGRAARNVNGKVIMYADTITSAMNTAISETNRRRKIQLEYNEKNGIVPKTITKKIFEAIEGTKVAENDGNLNYVISNTHFKYKTKQELEFEIEKLTAKMIDFANSMEFEKAAKIRDQIKALQEIEL